MTAPPRPRPDTGWWVRWLCRLYGHRHPTRLYQRGSELCDCPSDHTYPGCSRCGVHMDVTPWW